RRYEPEPAIAARSGNSQLRPPRASPSGRATPNSIRLVEVALDAGAKASYLVDFASEIDEAWLEGVTTVGLTSGASVPEVLVDEVLAWLAARGYGDVEIVKTAEESIVFSLPKELRRDLRAEAAELMEAPGAQPRAQSSTTRAAGGAPLS
ncbi:hypothetical protein ACIBEA_44130, partial [Streptomyces sp. NPDC051555]